MRLTTLASALYFQFAIFQMTLFNSLSVILMKQLSLTSTQFGAIASAYFFTGAIAFIPAGLLLDRYNIKRIICIIFLMNLLALLWVCLDPSITSVTVYRIISGANNGFAFISCMKILSKLFSGKRLNIVTSLVIAFAMLGGVSQAPFHYLITTFGWQKSLLSGAILGGIYWLIMLFGIHTTLIANVAFGDKKNYLQFIASFKNILRNPLNWQCGIYTGLLNLPVTLLASAWGSLYLMQNKHFSSTHACSIVSLIFIGMIISSPIVGWISSRFLSRKTTMLLGAIFAFMSILLIMMHGHLSFFQMALLFGLLGVFTTTQILSYPIVTETNPLHDTGFAMSFVSILIYAVGAGCNYLFGMITDISTHKLDAAFLLLPIAFVIAIVIAFFTNEKKFAPINSDKEAFNILSPL